MRWGDVTIRRSAPRKGSRVLLVLGGRAPEPFWLGGMREQGGWSLWAVDRGVDACCDAGWVPERILGDRDSAAPASWEWALSQGALESRYPREKDDTDLQLALRVLGSSFSEPRVLLTGAFGGRFDHLWSLMQSFLGGRGWIPLGCADSREGVLVLSGPEEAQLRFEGEIPEAVSLLPLRGDCSGVGIDGVRWPLKNTELLLDHPYAISNRLEEGNREVRAEVRRGTLGVYWTWDRGPA